MTSMRPSLPLKSALVSVTILASQNSIFAQSGTVEPTPPRRPQTTLAPPKPSPSQTISSSSTETAITNDYSRPSGTGISVFLGLDSAYLTSFPSKSEIESEKSGYFFGGKLVGSIFTNSMIADIGGGIIQSSLKGKRDFVTGEQGQEPVQNVTISTRIGFAELSPRYRLTPGISIGLLGVALFGEDGRFGSDNPLSDSKGTDSASSVATAFGGATAVYEWTNSLLISRIGVSAITDINIIERQVVALALSLQVGLPVLKQKTIVQNTNIHKVREQVKTENVEKIVTTVEVKERVKVLLDSESINFETNSAALKADSVKTLTALGRFLASNDTIWGRVVIEGHTDARGSTEHNMNLSRERAASVRKVLVKSGVPEARTQSGGYGSARPIDSRNTPLAWARNRRVEMTFSGVRDKAALSKGLENIQPARRGNTP